MASPKYRGDWQKIRTLYWLPKVRAGGVSCWRCGQLIVHDPTVRGGGWDLGHRPMPLPPHPEHAVRCNRSAGGREGALITNSQRRVRLIQSRKW